VTELRVQLPADVLESLAERAAAIVLERLAAEQHNGDSEFVSVVEAAELLRAKPQRVYDLLSDGRLTRHKDGARVLVLRSELVAHLRPTPRRRHMSNGVAR
jgi:excisionase family DNA binding protein